MSLVYEPSANKHDVLITRNLSFIILLFFYITPLGTFQLLSIIHIIIVHFCKLLCVVMSHLCVRCRMMYTFPDISTVLRPVSSRINEVKLVPTKKKKKGKNINCTGP